MTAVFKGNWLLTVLLISICACSSCFHAATPPPPPDLRIRIVGTASFQGKHTALIEDLNTHSDSFYKVGDPIYGYKITQIASDGIHLEKAGKKSFVAFEPTSLRARASETDKKVVVANTYVPSPSPAGATAPNFYTDAPKSKATTWDMWVPKASQGTTAKAPSMAGNIVANVGAGRFAIPVANFKKLSSAFGYRKHPIGGGSKMHKGIDLSANKGTRILAADAGTVTWSGWKGGYGYCIIINHHNGYETLYGHCSKLIADVGDNVRRNDLVGEVGSTGASTGNHLHFEIHKNGTPVDPEPFFQGVL